MMHPKCQPEHSTAKQSGQGFLTAAPAAAITDPNAAMLYGKTSAGPNPPNSTHRGTGGVCAPLGIAGKSTLKTFPKTGKLLQVPPQDDPVIHQSQEEKWNTWSNFPTPGIPAPSPETQPEGKKPRSDGAEAQCRRSDSQRP